MGTGASAADLVDRWIRAINQHDVIAVADCFAEHYEDEAPARRGESVQGRNEVRENFARLFKDVPDLRAELRGTASDGDTVWMEWSMRGTRPDGSRLEFVGVNIFEVRVDAFARGRIYTELVREAGGIEAQLERMASGRSEPEVKNKELVRRFGEEVFTKWNVDAVDELVAEEFVDHTAMPGQATGVEGIKQAAAMFRRAFPSWGMTVHGMIAEGDTVVFWGTGHGRHEGEFMGVSPTGREISIPGVHVIRVAGGKIAEHRGFSDQMGTMRQLGLMPSPGPPGA